MLDVSEVKRFLVELLAVELTTHPPGKSQPSRPVPFPWWRIQICSLLYWWAMNLNLNLRNRCVGVRSIDYPAPRPSRGQNAHLSGANFHALKFGKTYDFPSGLSTWHHQGSGSRRMQGIHAEDLHFLQTLTLPVAWYNSAGMALTPKYQEA